MSTKSYDPEDIGMLVLGMFSAAVMVGIAEISAFGFSLSDSFTFLGNTTTLAWVVAVGTFVGTIVTNDHTDLLTAGGPRKLLDSSLDDMYGYTVLAAGGLLVAWVFVPQVADFVTGSDLWGVAYIGLVASSQITLGWLY
ncbi:hypothetical protein [Halolamina sediminis]|uniref:hypothetical protein n=1 Tax=Halolamina sediminis TaxID=1480675 RepID=UPI0006B50DB6|nr:hypothetical protein [Halolamina sediminis]